VIRENAKYNYQENLFLLVIFCCFFLPWVLFLMARLSVYSNTSPNIPNEIPNWAGSEQMCLGARFTDWHTTLNALN
jgi:hypothetical protein